MKDRIHDRKQKILLNKKKWEELQLWNSDRQERRGQIRGAALEPKTTSASALRVESAERWPSPRLKAQTLKDSGPFTVDINWITTQGWTDSIMAGLKGSPRLSHNKTKPSIYIHSTIHIVLCHLLVPSRVNVKQWFSAGGLLSWILRRPQPQKVGISNKTPQHNMGEMGVLAPWGDVALDRKWPLVLQMQPWNKNVNAAATARSVE